MGSSGCGLHGCGLCGKTNGVYEAQTPVKYKAKTGSKVTPTPTKRTGFETPPEITETIQADGSTEIEYYYAREQHKITFESEEKFSHREFINTEVSCRHRRYIDRDMNLMDGTAKFGKCSGRR